MSYEIKAPVFPESVSEGTVAHWHKNLGEKVSRDQVLADIETDKIVLEVAAPSDGVLTEIRKNTGETVKSGEVIAIFDAVDKVASGNASQESEESTTAISDVISEVSQQASEIAKAGPAARKLMEESGITSSIVQATGKRGEITKSDVVSAINKSSSVDMASPMESSNTSDDNVSANGEYERLEKRVPMTRLRASIAKRLVEAQHQAAMLTTFNEVNMQPIMDLRATYKTMFEKVHQGVKLGFMGFFVRATAEALKRFPAVNASIDGNDIVYHGYQDVGVAVSSDRGLVVPVIRHVEHLSIANIEQTIRDYAERAQQGKIQIEELQGGTFTITNGGVFGSLMSTPILNPPQTGILGMHAIKDRPVVEKGEMVIRPMMYLALSYDHRVIDGREAVQFLVAIKNMIEDPARIVLDL